MHCYLFILFNFFVFISERLTNPFKLFAIPYERLSRFLSSHMILIWESCLPHRPTFVQLEPLNLHLLINPATLFECLYSLINFFLSDDAAFIDANLTRWLVERWISSNTITCWNLMKLCEVKLYMSFDSCAYIIGNALLIWHENVTE